ncbi:hypothetical protein D6C86_07809 [Aureobasidium pullulans]|uniref:Uncharacterized protein n=1 Tax=Aureobasidium pullulans TaxID=5580 RepID=A0A4V6TI65_AURPU|nr:hypothetical protein D6C94_05841 [Aureobasidium pullulans]THZ42401.1 hypothetical protein D6C87_05048 [Aureobasidium pullulans]THZ56490.1 hypothetical protein D6C86_07809 [Aureobasidium pullulans]THZ99313.1 hypothetical protein D6C88_00571 [Aureobasidium pullulans]
MQTSVPVDNEFDGSISRSPRAQGVKRDHAEENPQAPNKAPRLETITKRDGPLSDSPSQSATPSGTSRPKQVQSSARAIHEQRLPPMQKILATAPAPVRSPAHLNGSLPDFATQMNGQPLGPLRFDDTNQVASDSSLQNTSAAQLLPANFDHNISRMDAPVQNPRMAQVPTYSQASANGNAVFHALHDDQIGPYRQAPFHTAQLPSRPPPPHPCLHDVNLLSSIAQSLASLRKEKVLEILATAAMHHADIYATIQKELAQEAVGKHTTQSSLFKHLAAQSRDEYRAAAGRDNAIAAAYAAQAVQNPQRQQYQQYQQYQQNLQPGVIENEHNQVEEEVEEESEDEQEEEEEEPLTFAQNTNRVEYILHTRYAGLRDSQQSHIIFEAATKIEDQIENIASQVRNTSAFETKSEAVFELCNIGRLVVQQTNGYLGSKIQDHMSYSSVLVSSLQALCCKLEEREMMAIGRMLKNDLEQLDKEREGCFEGFDVVVEQFRQAAVGMREGGPKRSGAATIDLTG